VYSSLTLRLASKRARLRKAKMMRFGWRAATYDVGLLGDELAVLLVAPANRLGRDPATARAGGLGVGDQGSGGVVDRGGERFFNRAPGRWPARFAQSLCPT
jgi:hypothetical protein